MLQRLYIHNFRCLENFELLAKDLHSLLLIGRNGSGKSSIASALEVFQSIGRGTNRVAELISPKDFSWKKPGIPIKLILECILDGKRYQYTLAFELPNGFQELRVCEEELRIDDVPSYSREKAQVSLTGKKENIQFKVDWHLVALPIIQVLSEEDPENKFRNWLARMIILSPVPSLINGESQGESLEPSRNGSNLGEWVTGLLSRFPAAYSQVDEYLRSIMPDLSDIQNEPIGRNAKSLVIRFATDVKSTLAIDFSDLSDGEKCFFLIATVMAANKYYGPLLCFWDEPDNFLHLSEVQHNIAALRRAFGRSGQFIAAAHNEHVIYCFSSENTFVLDRADHLSPTVIRPLEDLSISKNLIENMLLGEPVR
jgi:predicted ATPase